MKEEGAPRRNAYGSNEPESAEQQAEKDSPNPEDIAKDLGEHSGKSEEGVRADQKRTSKS